VGFPDAAMGVEGVKTFFREAFNVDPLGAVALLGAHTIGSMSKSGSGYTGQWKVDLDDRVIKASN